jgi:hypothetical protein
MLVEAVGGVLCVNPRDVVFFFSQPDRSDYRATDFVLIRTRLDLKESKGIPQPEGRINGLPRNLSASKRY